MASAASKAGPSENQKRLAARWMDVNLARSVVQVAAVLQDAIPARSLETVWELRDAAADREAQLARASVLPLAQAAEREV
jgi:hypothetical protein